MKAGLTVCYMSIFICYYLILQDLPDNFDPRTQNPDFTETYFSDITSEEFSPLLKTSTG